MQVSFDVSTSTLWGHSCLLKALDAPVSVLSRPGKERRAALHFASVVLGRQCVCVMLGTLVCVPGGDVMGGTGSQGACWPGHTICAVFEQHVCRA